jgi:uncharacterized cupredoxin-like copper-binding protein
MTRILTTRAHAAVVCASLLLLAGVACAGGKQEPAAAEVSVELGEWFLRPSVASVKAGPVNFEARNVGSEKHELVIIRTDVEPHELTLKSGLDMVDEDASGEFIGEIEEFDVGLREKGTFDLPAGAYVLICNVPAHYSQGMWAVFTTR